MSVGMNAIWRVKLPKQKRCNRCELYTPKSLDKCIHCSELNEAQLLQLKAQHQESLHGNAIFGRYLIFGAIVIALLLLINFL